MWLAVLSVETSLGVLGEEQAGQGLWLVPGVVKQPQVGTRAQSKGSASKDARFTGEADLSGWLEWAFSQPLSLATDHLQVSI